MKIMRFLILTIVLLALYAPAQAQDNILYVSDNGSSNSNCTQSNPCTFLQAHALAVDGSVIQMKGTFGSILITKSGVTVRAVQLGDAIIDGSISRSHQRCVRVNDSNTFANRVVVENLVVRNCDSHGIIVRNSDSSVVRWNYVHNAVLERLRGGQWGSCIKGERGSTNLLVENNIVEQCNGEGIAATMVGGAVIRGNKVDTAFSVILYIDNSYSVSAYDNTILCTGNADFLRNGSRAKGITIGEENYSGWGAQSRNIEISNNYVEGCSTGIMAFNSDVGGTLTNVLIQDNTVPTGVSHAISIDHSRCSNVRVINNRIWKTNIWVRCSGVQLSGNTLYTSTETPPTPIPSTITPTVVVPPTSTVFATTPTWTPTITPSPTVPTPHPPTLTLTPIIPPTVTFTPTITSTATITVTPPVMQEECIEIFMDVEFIFYACPRR